MFSCSGHSSVFIGQHLCCICSFWIQRGHFLASCKFGKSQKLTSKHNNFRWEWCAVDLFRRPLGPRSWTYFEYLWIWLLFWFLCKMSHRLWFSHAVLGSWCVRRYPSSSFTGKCLFTAHIYLTFSYVTLNEPKWASVAGEEVPLIDGI